VNVLVVMRLDLYSFNYPNPVDSDALQYVSPSLFFLEWFVMNNYRHINCTFVMTVRHVS
jgi:hypothetical protein